MRNKGRTPRRVKVSATLLPDDYEWLQKQIKDDVFGDLSHALSAIIHVVRPEFKKVWIDKIKRAN